MRRLAGMVVLACGASLVLTGVTEAQEQGWLQRINPFRLSRNRGEKPLSTHSQLEKSPPSLGHRGINPVTTQSWLAPRNSLTYRERYRNDPEQMPGDTALRAAIQQRNGWVGEIEANGGAFADRSAAGQPPTVDELRQHLLSRGVSPEIVERQVERLSVPRGQDALASEAGAREREINRVRLEMQRRGLDPQQAERALEAAARSRAFSQRFEQRTLENGAPNYEQLRSRLSRGGEDPRTMNRRLGNSKQVWGGQNSAARHGAGRIR